MTAKFSLNVLLFGQHVQLHTRCIESIRHSLESDRLGLVSEVRVGLNRVHPMAERIAAELAQSSGRCVIAYKPDWPPAPSPAYKYPLMRKMLYDPQYPSSEFVVWLDDDSFLLRTPRWWESVLERFSEYDILGYLRRKTLNGQQHVWLPRQPWFNPKVGLPAEITFPQGGLAAWRLASLRKFNWPWPELRHCGGDSWLGELCRHQGLRLGPLPAGGVTNASLSGEADKSDRRGFSEAELGANLEPPTYDQHNFLCERTVYQDGKAERMTLQPDQYGPAT